MSTSMQDVGKSIICLKNLENGANSFNLSTNGAPKLISNAPDTWEDNRTELLTAFPKEEVSTNGQREIRKNLGVYWKKDEDILTFKPPPNLNTQSRSTMKQMLSHAARVYDPLGAHSTVYWPDETVVSALFGMKPDSAERAREFQPFLDQDGLLRVGARLRRSTLPPESKHPIILRHNHPTLVAIRTGFWIVRDRNATKKVIRSCPVCRRVDAQPYRLRMVVLPADRVAETPPFIHTGVDFAGPLFIRPDVQGCDARANKAYVFRDLSPAESDPEDSIWEKLQRKFNEERIRWKFITPRAPWCGGYWERLIQLLFMESDEIQFVFTQRNQQKLVYKGRCYTLKRMNRNDKCWICASGTRGCPGKLSFPKLETKLQAHDTTQ
ncbi:hypothetical protein T02_11034 [Trichinella nativa]|uniref:Integrase zinc-binding domain-containing protein n=1 Tax=Trichinella nativa TaxID=6335 RepID=A0A0V1KP51_9BILA|nr:hypothetical protein T02_11034 [Trichinella nativa]